MYGKNGPKISLDITSKSCISIENEETDRFDTQNSSLQPVCSHKF